MVAQSKPSRLLGKVEPGTKVRLFSKYRDGESRPRYRFGKVYLQQETLQVLEHRANDVTIVSTGKVTVPLWSRWRING